jgi:hypothetical protein
MVLALVCWVVAIAFIYAMIEARAHTGALMGVARVAYLRALVFVGQSALDEASFVIRHPRSGGPSVVEDIRKGISSGIAHDPLATRDAYGELVKGGLLRVDPVGYTLVSKPSSPRR